jgi:hypothetical protein
MRKNSADHRSSLSKSAYISIKPQYELHLRKDLLQGPLVSPVPDQGRTGPVFLTLLVGPEQKRISGW